MRARLLCALFVVSWALPCLGETEAPTPTDESILRRGTSVVLGRFTGETSEHLRTYRARDSRGNRVRHAITVHELQVVEVLAGRPLPERVRINVIGGARGLPEAGVQVALSLHPDRLSSRGGYVVMHMRSFPAATEAEIERIQSLIKKARRRSQPVPEPTGAYPPRPGPVHFAPRAAGAADPPDQPVEPVQSVQPARRTNPVQMTQPESAPPSPEVLPTRPAGKTRSSPTSSGEGLSSHEDSSDWMWIPAALVILLGGVLAFVWRR